MLSGETAGGDFPVEAVTIMRRIVEEAESSLDFLQMYLTVRNAVAKQSGRMSAVEALASTVVKTAADSGAPLILVFTGTGSTARVVAKYRPEATILAVTDSEYTARSLLTSRGMISMITSLDADVDTIAKRAMEHARRVGVAGVKSGAAVAVCFEERAQGSEAGSKLVKLLRMA